jgi:myo-inositol-1(or 4)-monophosphatase
MREPLVNIAIQAARAAGDLIVRALDRPDKMSIREKNPRDFVTNVDQQVEREIISIIHKAYPNHSFLGEEGGRSGDSEGLWIIDPIDGTRNFIHGFPHFAVSIAYSYRNRIEHGVIYDPLRQELFTATRGKGAHLNERRIRVSAQKKLENCLLGTGFPSHHPQEVQNQYLKMLQAIVPICGDVRRAGAATLDLAYVACGRLDGFWEMGLNLWDIAAGVLLVKEAGGIVCDPEGGEDYLKTGNVVAASPLILKQALQILRPHTMAATAPVVKEK